MRPLSRYILSISIYLLLGGIIGYAAPAFPGVVTIQQADGSSLQIRVNGDEFFRWRSTLDGQPISESDGYYYYARYNSSGEVERSEQRVKQGGVVQPVPSNFVQGKAAVAAISSGIITQQRAARSAINITRSASLSTTINASATNECGIPDSLDRAAFPNSGGRTVILLLEFIDCKFSLLNANANFSAMLNQEGYSSSNGAVGSAHDYFKASSHGLFDCDFDVYGPYTLDNNMAYYGANSNGGDIRPQQMVIDGVKKASSDGVDFSQYDMDGDGVIDNVFVYYAGYNEAEGASQNTIWPHMWAVLNHSTLYNGKSLYSYACTSELRGASGSVMAGVGTFCHEFSHVLGLYDHYDTDGEVNGESYGLFYNDIMSYGNYNNDGNSPPLYNALELMTVGWKTPLFYSKEEKITQQPITSGEFYRIDTEVEHEFFLIENRQKSSSVWENYLTDEGLMITHVDMSTARQSLWLKNNPNGDISHECFKIIPANDAMSIELTSSANSWSNIFYPLHNKTSWNSQTIPRAQSWSGATLGYGLRNIMTSGESISYKVTKNTAEDGGDSNQDSANCYLIPWQSEALIGWHSPTKTYDSIRIELSSSSSNLEYTRSSMEGYIIVENLQPGSIYFLAIYGVSGSESTLLNSSRFSTIAKISTTPLIGLSRHVYSLGSDIYLKMLNRQQGDITTWYFNGKQVDEGFYSLNTEGEHKIKCVVERSGDTYIIIKEISVL